jgi:hypothetical protein
MSRFDDTQDITRLCRSYLKEFGETAGYTLQEFEGNLDPRAEVPEHEIDEMLQNIFDAI